VLHIATGDWLSRTGVATGGTAPDGKLSVVQSVDVYTNLRLVELFANKKSLGVRSVGPTRKASWDVPFEDGLNVLEARGGTSSAEVRFLYRSSTLADPLIPFRELAVNVGSTSKYVDAAGLVWEADQPYARGAWGCTGGDPVTTNRNILGTADDPLYQSARQGLTLCRFDVPDGRYEVELRFAEHSFQQPGERVFSVSLNGNPVIANLDLVKEHDSLRAEARVFQVNATNKQGVIVHFSASIGEAVLSALRIRKLK
jgi:beta-galactosidase